ncbi:MAG: hypothetical protein A2035_04600 [Nitrospirae bacterium GWA2_42_11]|nr:MAG: hypothetical protein A2035_04600 [Nitrospirae bacterium GWA2_42_11]
MLNQAEKTDQADPHHDKLMEKILSLYQGPFLEEDGMPWAYAVRERLASKFVRSPSAGGGAIWSKKGCMKKR